ncbi:DoxX family protein [Flavihumibacter sp. ZG627]|uniref:DoxX family protein n=1 Tax=Flavihumibacter sp. ZG627 TaxID=1463156 RepID=UPI00057CDBE6|nr:DoxX family protein [Flavihumibacter sp. ZG627]KIC92044.1 hypothetical protein HY58_00230 [Flavihumibacter sp. ZG627]
MKQFFSPSNTIWYHQGIALVRVIVGFFMAYHGWEIFNEKQMSDYAKWLSELHFPQPLIMAYLGKGAELISGILIMVGLFTRLAVIPMIATMLVIAFGMGKGKVHYEDQHPFMFVLIGALFFFIGPGRWSLDQALFGKNDIHSPK